MGNFISNLIARHTTAANYVLPRLRGRFEPQAAAPAEGTSGYFPAEAPPPQALRAPATKLPGEEDLPPQEAQEPGKAYDPAVVAATAFVTPPSGVAALFKPPSTAQRSTGYLNGQPLQPSFNSREAPGIPDSYALDNRPDPVPGTVNSFIVNNRPAQQEGLPETPIGKEQHAALSPLYFSVDQPGRQHSAFTFNNPPAPAMLAPDRSSYRSEQPGAAAAAQSVIKVTIGRIDVRAVPQPAAAKTGAAPNPAMSLDDFLKKRSGGTS